MSPSTYPILTQIYTNIHKYIQPQQLHSRYPSLQRPRRPILVNITLLLHRPRFLCTNPNQSTRHIRLRQQIRTSFHTANRTLTRMPHLWIPYDLILPLHSLQDGRSFHHRSYATPGSNATDEREVVPPMVWSYRRAEVLSAMR